MFSDQALGWSNYLILWVVSNFSEENAVSIISVEVDIWIIIPWSNLCLPTFVEKPVASSLSISVKVLLINV
jgi:hypothetical protein